MSDDYDVVRLDDLDRIPVGDTGLEWRPIRRLLGIRAFGTNAYTSSHVGGEVVEAHDETQAGHEEIYVVVRGQATFHLDGKDVDAPTGTLVYVREPNVQRAATAQTADTLVLAVGGKPGEAFKPSAWESFFPAAPLSRAGKHDEAIALMLADAEDFQDHPGWLYNLACYEARGGRTDDAITHITRAVELDQRFREYAEKDTDFDSLRGDPRFQKLLS